MKPVEKGLQRRWAALIAVLASVTVASGCAPEVYKGPRVVPYTDTSFYVRHLPLLSGARSVDQLAADICAGRQAKAVLVDAYQDVPLGLRYATYECI
ncbi:MAG: hypothetical protein ACXW3P_04555 [Rhodospirillales bacterium]